MPDRRPSLSIGMSVRNCRETLHLAVGSLLLQTYTDWELLLLDDGSTDGTADLARSFTDPRIQFFCDGRRRGLAARLNEAIAASRGGYFARMDGDDLAYPDRLRRQVDYLDTHPDVDLVGASVLVFRGSGTAVGKRAVPGGHDAICHRPLLGFPMAHPTFAGRLEWFRRHGYRNDSRLAQDQDLLLRSYRSSRFANVPEILLAYREERISLSKLLAGRRCFMRSVLRECRREGRLDRAIRAQAEQGLRAIADCVAVGTGLGYRLLRHRGARLTSRERQQWAGIWRLVSQRAQAQFPGGPA